jgi:hypothetical protein
MTLPTLLFALLLVLLYGSLYHLVRGGGFGRLLLCFLLSLFGFAMGHLVGLWRGWLWFPVGSINLGLSSLGSLLILVFGDWLTRIEGQPESKV